MATDSIIFGEVPRYTDLRGGNDTNLPTVERVDLDKNLDESRIFHFVSRLKEDMKSAKSLFSQNWDYYYSLFMGRQWVMPTRRGGLRETRLPPWRAQLTINYIMPVIDQEVATIFDNKPKPYLSATSPEQNQYVAMMQAALDHIWVQEDIQDKLEMATTDSKIYGTSFLKLVWDPAGDRGLGAIRVFNVPVENIYVNREATSLRPGDYTAICELSQMPLSTVRKMFPKRAALIRTDPGTLPYQERKEVGGFGQWGYDSPSMLISPGTSAGLKDYTAAAPFQTAFSGEDYMIEVTELWIVDTSKKEVTYQERVGVNPWGAPIMTTRTKVVDAYPNGRLITVGGGVVLQDRPSPYQRPPYVMVRNFPLARRFWGIGVPEMVADQQIELNKRRSQMMDAANRMGNPVWVIDEEAGVSPEMDCNEPGAMIMKRAQASAQRLSPPDMPRWIMEMMHIPVTDIYAITGVGNSMNNPTAGKRSGTAVVEAASNATLRVRRGAAQVDLAIRDVAQILIELVQKFWNTPRWVQVMGTWGKPTPVPFDLRHARGQWDIKVESGSAAASSKLARRQEALMLYDKKVINPMHLLEALDWPDRDRIARDMGYYQMPQPMNYQGWPGFPNPNSSENSGYSMQARYGTPPAPPGPPGMPPGAPMPMQTAARPKKSKGGASPSLAPTQPFGTGPIGSALRK